MKTRPTPRKATTAATQNERATNLVQDLTRERRRCHNCIGTGVPCLLTIFDVGNHDDRGRVVDASAQLADRQRTSGWADHHNIWINAVDLF
jgi:hypothetical protein